MIMSDKKLKVAVIGAGSMALEHIKAFKDVAQVEIVGIFSRTKEKAMKLAAEFAIPLVCESIDELYEKTKSDLVLVTVFETAMLDVALKSLDYPWQVFLEKPPGYNLEQALQIHEKAKSKNKEVLVGLNRRCLSSTVGVHNTLQNSASKRFIYVADQQDLATARHFNHPEVVVKNWMYANSIHTIDYLTYFCRGEIESVTPLHKWEPDKTFILLAQIKYTSGDEGLYHGVWSGPGPWAVTVQTPEDRWELRPLEKALHQKHGERKLTELPINEWDLSFKPGFRLQAQKVYDYCLNTARLEDVATLDSALQTMKIINKIFSI